MAKSKDAAKAGRSQTLKDPKAIAAVVVIVLVVMFLLLRAIMSGPPTVPLDSANKTRDRLRTLIAEFNSFVVREQRLPSTLEDGMGKLDPALKQDGWGHEFVFSPGTAGPKKTSYVIRSGGADGIPDNEDDFVGTSIFGNDGYGNLGVHSGSILPEADGK